MHVDVELAGAETGQSTGTGTSTGIGIGTELALNGVAAHAFAHIVYKALLQPNPLTSHSKLSILIDFPVMTFLPHVHRWAYRMTINLG